MKNLLKIVTECVDKFSDQRHIDRSAAIIGGEAIILHGIPRTTLDIDILILIMTESEKEKTYDLASNIRRDKNLLKILNQGKRNNETVQLETIIK